MEDKNVEEDMQEFIRFFIHLGSEDYSEESEKMTKLFREIKAGNMKSQFQSKSSYTSYSSLRMHDTFMLGINLWLLKPVDYNRGRGINLFNKLTTLRQHLLSYHKENDINNSKKLDYVHILNNQNKYAVPSFVKTNKFVLQKYVESPLLINQRKFDIRVWVLVDHEMNFYFFK